MPKKLFHPRNLLIIGLAFLWLRNGPLALFLPIWSHGDEIGHFDYVMKLGRGHLPRPDEYIEPAVFRLHKGHYDGRFISPDRKMVFVMPADLGLAAYSYEAVQPPLPYLLLAALRLPMKAAGLPLLAQVKGLRLAALLAVSAGLLILYLAMRRRPDLGLFWHAPLLFIPLLAQDMFVSINTDAFAFLFGCGVVWAIFGLFDRPASAGRWGLLALTLVLAMSTKATCAFFFALWPILAAVLGRSVAKGPERRRVFALAAVFLVAAGVLSAPWYILNYARNSYLFGFQFKEKNDLSYKRFDPPPLQRKEILEFKNAFGHTLLRGEILWHGAFLDGLPQPWANILTEIVFWIVFAAGLFAVFLPVGKFAESSTGPYVVLAAAGFGVIASLFVLNFSWGGIPFYHARYAFAGLFPIMLVFAGGCRRLIPEDRLAVALPALVLLGHNAAYTYRLVIRVLSPN